MQTTKVNINVTKISESRITKVDFNNLIFGKTFTDHMFVCDYKNGQWETPQILPYGPMSVEPSAKVFHYGQSVFEGMKAFKDEAGKVFLFRPEDNHDRINKSAARMAIPEFPREYFMDGLETLLNLDKDWIKPGKGNSLYIRPFVIATESGVSASPSSSYRFIIICAPANAYYKGEVRVLFAEKYSRSADGGVGFAKAAGNYGAQFHPTNLAIKEGFQQIIWTDANTHEFLEEAGTMNIFFRVGNKLITAPNNDRILDGITRKSVIQIARDNNIEVEIRPVSVKEIKDAARQGELKEIFGSGTAATINPIVGFGHANETFELPLPENSYSSFFKAELVGIQTNTKPDPYGWRHEVL